jgi:hypothetical protein
MIKKIPGPDLHNCFAMMTLNGASATVEYYEVPLLQAARQFAVTDVEPAA